MNPEVLTRILWLAVEGDSGLWEVLWDLTAHYPDLPAQEREALAWKGVAELVGRKWIRVCSCVEPGGSLSSLSEAQIKAALAEKRSWRAPAKGGVSIRITATDSGRAEVSASK